MPPPLNQIAPPAEAPKQDFVKLDPFPQSDSHVLTFVAFNYIPSHPFERTDDKTGETRIEHKPALEFYLGGVINGVAYFAKTWPKLYSLSEKASYYKWYAAATGKAPAPGSNPADIIGKQVLCEVHVEDKVSAKGTRYRTTSIKSVGKVPSLLAGTGTDIGVLLPAFAEQMAKADSKDNKNVPF